MVFSCKNLYIFLRRNIHKFKSFLKMPQPKQSPVRKSLNDIKVKYSPVKKQNSKYNNVFVKGYKFGLMTLEFMKFSDPNEDAY